MCSPARPRSSARTSWIWFGSSPAVGSSRRTISGRATSASAIPTRWRYPLDSLPIIASRTPGDAGLLHRLVDPRAPVSPGHALHLGAKAEVLDDPHLRIERRLLRQVADLRARLDRRLVEIEPGHLHRPRGLAERAREDAQGRRLPCPVRSEEPGDRPPRHDEAHPVHRQVRPVALGEPFDLDGGHASLIARARIPGAPARGGLRARADRARRAAPPSSRACR